MYKTLDLLSLDGDKILPWWVYSYKVPKHTVYCRKLVYLLLNVRRHGKTPCDFCYGKVDSIVHIIFECPAIGSVREELWSHVKACSTIPFIESIDSMNAKDKCKFVLNGFNVKYMHEWKYVYASMLKFIVKVYQYYVQKVESLQLEVNELVSDM